MCLTVLRRCARPCARSRATSGSRWLPGARALFEELGRERFAARRPQPDGAPRRAGRRRARGGARRPTYVERARARPGSSSHAERERRTWWQRREEDDAFGVAYFSCEFGLDESLPIYSGGLGVLAGDHLKSASDLGVPARRRRPLLPRGLLPPAARRERLAGRALSGDRSRAPAADARARQRSPSRSRTTTARSSPCAHRSGARRSGACRSTCSTPTSTATRTGRERSPTGSTAATGATGCGRSSCSASAACARCARSASSRRCST